VFWGGGVSDGNLSKARHRVIWISKCCVIEIDTEVVVVSVSALIVEDVNLLFVCVTSYGMQVQVKHFLSILSMARGHGLLTSLSWILQNWLVEATIVLSNYGASMR